MKKYWILILLYIVGFVWSGINPHDYFTWILEVFPAIIGFVILLLTYKKFTFTDLTYFFILIHCYILFVGGHFTYAEVPLFNWVRDIFHQSRNNYDKVGHFMQGFVPALIARELFIRREIVKKSLWQSILPVCISGSITALYEIFEWLVAVSSGESAEAFLGMQGDVWDTQSDMLFAFIGATCMIILFSKIQNKQIDKITNAGQL